MSQSYSASISADASGQPKELPVTDQGRPARRVLQLSRDQIQKIAEKQRAQRMMALGACVTLLARVPEYQSMTLKELETAVFPAIAAGQYLFAARKPSRENSGGIAALLLWAKVSPAINERLSDQADLKVDCRLNPQEWTSGDIPRVMALIGPEGATKPLMQEFLRRTNPIAKETSSGI